MRATRNASKGTPPAAKKTGKGTPGKGTPKTEKKEDTVKAEKQEDNVKAEANPVAASEGEPVDGNKDEKPEDMEMVGTANDAEDSKAESDKLAKESTLQGEQAAKESKEQSDTEVSKVVEKVGSARDGTDEEGDERNEAKSAEQEEDAGTDDAGNDEAEEDEEQEDEDEDEDEEGEEDEEEGDDELVEPRPDTERQKRKKLEVFVGGLDKEATAEEVKKTFEAVGDVQEVRLMTHPQSGKNRGYAFVRFATVEQAMKAAAELDRTKIRDKECAVVPSEDNDTLFVGNICKSWSSEQVTEKLKEYGVEGIDEMVLVEDRENEGHNRGHAFLEFVTHNDAIKAFKRLSKPDAIFGCDRSAKVAWAEGSSEPDEVVMAKVKSVFVSGTPEQWENDKITEYFGKFGEIERIVLAKNISRSKRTDFAFVNYATRDAAVAAVEAMNDAEITDGDKKVTLKVELAKPTTRKKRMRGHRGSYPVGGRPSKQQGKGDARNGQKKGEGGRGNQKKGDGGRLDQKGGRGNSRGGRTNSQKNLRGTKRKVAEEKSLPEERSRDRQNRGSKNFRAAPKVGSSRRRRSGPYSDDDYMPMGARISPGYAPTRGYTGRRPRETAYPLRAERGVTYSGLGAKRSYSAVDEEAAYYGSGPRGYPRARVEYGDPALYADPLRATSLGHVLPRGGHNYTSVLPAPADYAGYAPGSIAADPRGVAYPSAYYGSRGGSGYNVPSGPGPYY